MLYYLCTAPRLWNSFALLSLTQPFPQLCPWACPSCAFLTPTSSNHPLLSAGREGFSPKPVLPRAYNQPQPSASSVLCTHLHLWVLSPELAISPTEGVLFSLPFCGLFLKKELRNEELYLLLLVVGKGWRRADVLLVPGGLEKWGRQTMGRLQKKKELQNS